MNFKIKGLSKKKPNALFENGGEKGGIGGKKGGAEVNASSQTVTAVEKRGKAKKKGPAGANRRKSKKNRETIGGIAKTSSQAKLREK